jgi:hypothetical protein
VKQFTPNSLLARDAAMRQAALQSRELALSHQEIERGFQFEAERFPFVNPQRGIFKPTSSSLADRGLTASSCPWVQ